MAYAVFDLVIPVVVGGDDLVDGVMNVFTVVVVDEGEEFPVLEAGTGPNAEDRVASIVQRHLPRREVDVPDADAGGRDRDSKTLAGGFERLPRLLGVQAGGGLGLLCVQAALAELQEHQRRENRG